MKSPNAAALMSTAEPITRYPPAVLRNTHDMLHAAFSTASVISMNIATTWTGPLNTRNTELTRPRFNGIDSRTTPRTDNPCFSIICAGTCNGLLIACALYLTNPCGLPYDKVQCIQPLLTTQLIIPKRNFVSKYHPTPMSNLQAIY